VPQTSQEKYRLKGIQDENNKTLLRIVRKTYNKYINTQNNTNKRFQCIKKKTG